MPIPTSEPPTIRRAVAADAALLTRIAFASKRYWGYPEAYLELWREGLTVSAASIADWRVFLSVCGAEVCGFYALDQSADGVELEALFVSPEWIGRGIGGVLLRHALAQAAGDGALSLIIAADPNAVGFYQRYGATRIGERPSSPPGRMLPLLQIALKPT